MRIDSASNIWAEVHPLLLPWCMPLMMVDWWTQALIGALPRGEEPDRQKPDAQLRVPGTLQRTKDRELFA